MKGKIAFLVGAAVGYVLGTRAGRERYEQIKRGAEAVWQTEPVQRGVGIVKGAVDDRADEVKAFARRVGADLFGTIVRGSENGAKNAGGARPRPGGSGAETSGAEAGDAADAATPAEWAKARSAEKSADGAEPRSGGTEERS